MYIAVGGSTLFYNRRNHDHHGRRLFERLKKNTVVVGKRRRNFIWDCEKQSKKQELDDDFYNATIIA